MSELLNSVATPDEELPPPAGEICQHCGGPLAANDSFCGACGQAQTPAEAETPPAPENLRQFRCTSCGAILEGDPEQLSFTCPFCDSNFVVDSPGDSHHGPDPEFVVGFRITREQALEKFHQWLGSGSWFHPGDLKQSRIAEKLRGVYLPFWSFAMLVESDWSATIGEYWWRTETYTTTVNGKTVTRTRRVRETEWWPLSGKHHHYYNGYLISASSSLPQEYAGRIKPFRLEALQRYAPSFLAGWLCERTSMVKDEALSICREEFARWAQRDVGGFLPGDTSSELQVRSRYGKATSDLILLPVYLLSYRYQDRVFRFLVNGQTGRVAGDKPVSHKRVAAAVVAGLLALGAVIGGIIYLWNS